MKKSFFFTGLLFFLLACTKDKSVSDKNLPDNAAIASKAGDGPITQNVVHITNSSFSPDSLLVNVNSTVAWANDDNVIHTVSSDKFESGDILPGSIFKLYFDNTGTYYYHCKYHGEKAVIVVAGVR